MLETSTGDKIKIPSKRQFCALLPFALLYTIFIIFADLEKAEQLGVIRNVLRIFFCMVICYAVLLLLCFLISGRKFLAAKIPFMAKLPKQHRRQGKWYVYLLFFCVCFVSYLPFFLMYYPTWFNNDAIWQMEQILGLAPKSNHHPYFHTMIMGVFIRLGYRLFGNETDAVAFYTFWQIFIMAMVYAFVLYQLYKRGTRILWLFLALLFYVVLPVNGIQTLCMGKDEFFIAALLVFSWAAAMAVRQEKKYPEEKKFFYHILCCVSGLLVCLLRSNGIFIFLGTMFFWLISDICKKKFAKGSFLRAATFKKYACILGVLVCFGIYHGPVLHLLQVEPPDTIEGLTMPVQHVMCAYLKGGSLTPEEVEMIRQVVPLEGLEEYYNPYLFDPMKARIREAGNQQVIEEEKWEYFKLWLRLGIRNPLQYVVAQVRQTMGYWAYRVKDYQYIYGEYFMVDNPFGVTAERKFFTYDDSLKMDEYLKNFRDLFNKVWGLGLTTWLMLFALAYAVYARRNVMICIPYVMLFLSLMLAAPVYNEFRYTYGMFVAMPFILSDSFGESGSSKTGEKGEDDEKVV